MKRQEPMARDGKRPRAMWLPWAETVVLAAVPLLLGRWLRPEDPSFLGGPFSWTVLPVVLVSLHHGLAHGLAGAVALGLGMAAAGWGGDGMAFPAEACLGLLVMAVVAGEFRGLWLRRLLRAERMEEEQRLRWERLSRAWHLLRASHARLEERLVGGAPSLREVLSGLRGRLVAPSGGEEPLRELGERLLGLVAAHCGVQAAALHALTPDGALEAEPVAVFGGCRARAEEPLVREALKTRCLVSVCSFTEREVGSRLLVALPLVDTRGRVRGLLAISEMRFLSFDTEVLELLAVLGVHVGELLEREVPEEPWEAGLEAPVVPLPADSGREAPEPLREAL